MTDVVMPQMGESIVEGTLTRWLKKPGEKVERDEPLFEISTDKVDTEIPSPVAGVLSEVLVQEGTTVAINSIVARIGESNGASAAAPAAAPEPPAATPPPSKPVTTQPSVDVGPSAAAREVVTTAPQPPSPPPSAPPAAAGPYPSQPSPQAPPPPAPTAQPDGQEDGGPLS
ncbi:MAG: 2-oxoglutarate dehydrogenase, partial [Acidobacteriaceae bacterium]|nr:2-oxoglutarate dehydrogenase [Acidobacteriaceae bacterium]